MRELVTALAFFGAALAPSCTASPPPQVERARPRHVASAATAKSPASVAKPTCQAPQLHLWADGAAQPYQTDGAVLLSDGLSIATQHQGVFVQDTWLSSTPECDVRDRFFGLTGKAPDALWAVRGRRATGETLLLRTTSQGWRVSRRFASSRALYTKFRKGGLLVVQGAEADGRYELTPLSADAPSLRPGPVDCPRYLQRVNAAAGNAAGQLALLGSPCGRPEALAIVLSRFEGATEVIEAPPGLGKATLALAEDGTLLLAGTRGASGVLFERAQAGWEERATVPSGVFAIAALGVGDAWLLTDAPAAVTGCPELADRDLAPSNVWHCRGSRCDNVSLRREWGNASSLSTLDGGQIAVTTATSLLRTDAPAKTVRWTNWKMCPLPITGAQPYTYRAARPGAERQGWPVQRVGSDCPHHVFVDVTDQPSSTVFGSATSMLANSDAVASALQDAEAYYDAKLARPEQVEPRAPMLWVSFERGRYYWGFSDGVLEQQGTVAELLRAHFPRQTKEVCAAPLPVRISETYQK